MDTNAWTDVTTGDWEAVYQDGERQPVGAIVTVRFDAKEARALARAARAAGLTLAGFVRTATLRAIGTQGDPPCSLPD